MINVKNIKTLALLVLAMAVLLAACSSEWSPGNNTVANDGTIAFYNGVSMNQLADTNVLETRETVVFGGEEALRSIYECRVGEDLFFVLQISRENGFKQALESTTPDDFEEAMQSFANGLTGSFESLLPDANISNPEITLLEKTSSSEEKFVDSTWIYTITYSNVTLKVHVRLIVSQNDVIAVYGYQAPDHLFMDGLMDKIVIG